MHGVRLLTTWPHDTSPCAIGIMVAPRASRHRRAIKKTLVCKLAMTKTLVGSTDCVLWVFFFLLGLGFGFEGVMCFEKLLCGGFRVGLIYWEKAMRLCVYGVQCRQKGHVGGAYLGS